jgi:flagellar biosynthetic protein FlhB
VYFIPDLLAFYIFLLISLIVLRACPLPGLVPAGSIPEAFPGSGRFFAATEEKTEEPTPHRRQEARKKGQVSRSSDLNAAIVIIIIIIFLYIMREYLVFNLSGYVQHIFSKELLQELTPDEFFGLYRLSLNIFFNLLGPIFLLAVFFGLILNFLQVGFLFAPEAIKPKISNINPVEGFKKIYSKRALFEFIKTLLKVMVVSFAIYILLKNKLEKILLMPEMNIFAIMNHLEKTIFEICIGAALVFLLIAVLDFMYQKWQFRQTLKMSKYEVKQEMKQTEGDPYIKSRLREKQRIMARNRMMQQVPEATVVITNPTHLAVALKYEENKMEAPQLVAKGGGYLAIRIKEKAVESDIPVMEDRPLAHALYEGVEIGDYIPEELYQAVAGIIAAIYLLERNKG